MMVRCLDFDQNIFILYYIILYYILYYIILFYIILYHIILYYQARAERGLFTN